MKKILLFTFTLIGAIIFFMYAHTVNAQSCPAGQHPTNPTVCVGPAQAYCTEDCFTTPEGQVQCNGGGDSTCPSTCMTRIACGDSKGPACICVPDSGGGGSCGSVCDGSFGSCAQGTCTQQGAGQPSICVCSSGGGECSNVGEGCGGGNNCCSGLWCNTSNVCSTIPTNSPPSSRAALTVYIDEEGDGVDNTRDDLCPNGRSNSQCINSGYTKCTGGPFSYYADAALITLTSQIVYSDLRTSNCYRDNNNNNQFEKPDMTPVNYARVKDNLGNNRNTNDQGTTSPEFTYSTAGTFTYSVNPLPGGYSTSDAIITYIGVGDFQQADIYLTGGVTIQGWRTGGTGTTTSSPPAGTSVSITGPQEGSSSTQSRTTNPWDFSGITKGTYVITASTATGYNISYMCNQGNCGSLTPGIWYSGNSFTHTLPNPGNYADIYFRYTPQKTPPTPCLVSGAGDVNGNGFVTYDDAVLVQQHYLGLITLTPAQLIRADVNKSGTISIQDSALINAYVNGTITTFASCSAATPTLPAGTTATITPGGTLTVTPPVCSGTTSTQTVSGYIYVDTAGNNCASGTSQYLGTAPNLTLRNNGIIKAGPVTYNSSGVPAYSLTDTTSCSTATKTVGLSGLPSVYAVSGYRLGAASSFTQHAGYDVALPSPSSTTLDWCVSTASSWFQTDTGDVRYSSLTNRVPAGNFGSISTLSTNVVPGVFFSSDDLISPTTFGQGAVSSRGWKVSDEYSYNDDFKNGLGGMSYTFFNSQVRKKDFINATNSIYTELSSTAQHVALGLNPSRSTIYHKNGNLRIESDGNPLSGGRDVIILATGDITITDPVSVSPGSVLVVAAKGDIIINSDIGSTPNSPTSNLDGYYTAEKNIQILSTANCASSVSDLRLNVSGALIANSLRPFSTSGDGKILNARTLCAGNASNPSLFVSSRPDFLTQLTDFYKTTYKVYTEVSP